MILCNTLLHLDLLKQMATPQVCPEEKPPCNPDNETPSKKLLQANLSTSRGWDFLRGWMSVRVRGKRSSKRADLEEKEEEGEQVEIGRVGKEEEKLRSEEQQRRKCDLISINGGAGFLQKVSTDV